MTVANAVAFSDAVSLPSHAVGPARPPRVAIVVVNYNGYADVVRCIESLRGLAYRNFFLVIVDNSSPDGSGRALADEFSDRSIHVIQNPENGGFAAGNNVGIRHAFAYHADYVWLLNGDTTVDPQALSQLVETAQANPRYGALGSKIFYGERTSQAGRIWSAGGHVDLSSQSIGMYGTGESDSEEFSEPRVCDYIPGCSLLISRAVVEEVGYLKEEYFMYFEETDWCLRIQRSGFENFYCPKSIVFHHFSDEKMQTPFTVYYYNRNQRIFWSRFGAGAFARLRAYWRVLTRDFPQAFRALYACNNPAQVEVFRAHVWSCVDFLLRRHGKRW